MLYCGHRGRVNWRSLQRLKHEKLPQKKLRWKVKHFRGAYTKYKRSTTEIVECMEIIEVGRM